VFLICFLWCAPAVDWYLLPNVACLERNSGLVGGEPKHGDTTSRFLYVLLILKVFIQIGGLFLTALVMRLVSKLGCKCWHYIQNQRQEDWLELNKEQSLLILIGGTYICLWGANIALAIICSLFWVINFQFTVLTFFCWVQAVSTVLHAFSVNWHDVKSDVKQKAKNLFAFFRGKQPDIIQSRPRTVHVGNV
jgi:hypothetical protein